MISFLLRLFHSTAISSSPTIHLFSNRRCIPDKVLFKRVIACSRRRNSHFSPLYHALLISALLSLSTYFRFTLFSFIPGLLIFPTFSFDKLFSVLFRTATMNQVAITVAGWGVLHGESNSTIPKNKRFQYLIDKWFDRNSS